MDVSRQSGGDVQYAKFLILNQMSAAKANGYASHDGKNARVGSQLGGLSIQADRTADTLDEVCIY